MAGPSLQLLTITGLWTLPKYMYMFGKINLAAVFGPVSLRLILFAAVAFAPAWLLLGLLGVEWSSSTLFLRVTLPLMLVWWGLRQAANGGSPVEVAAGAVWWWLQVAAAVVVAGVSWVAGRGRVSGLLVRSSPVRRRIPPARQVLVDDVVPGRAVSWWRRTRPRLHTVAAPVWGALTVWVARVRVPVPSVRWAGVTRR